MSDNMIPKSYTLTPDLAKQLEDAAWQARVTASAYLRAVLAEHFLSVSRESATSPAGRRESSFLAGATPLLSLLPGARGER